ncbi:hypothetical protein FS837_012890 [Tulasnella sp. UAMH 9824]|nr:hypothetical protein FS837_012890 [Tulasnella sp. UAMH 9824]
MDEILGTTRWSELYLILEGLSTSLQQIPTHINDFCRAVCEYPDEALREELTTMVREARLRESVRLEEDLVNITPNNYFEKIDYWLGDIDEEAIHCCVIHWANAATELGGACQIASRAVERSWSEWALTERWLQDVEVRQRLLEDDTTVRRRPIWSSDSRGRLSHETVALSGHLEPILRHTQDLRQTIEQLGRFWEQLSSDIRAVPPDRMSNNRTLIVSSGRGKALVKQWSTVTDMVENLWTDRDRAANLVEQAPPRIKSTAAGQSVEFSLPSGSSGDQPLYSISTVTLPSRRLKVFTKSLKAGE